MEKNWNSLSAVKPDTMVDILICDREKNIRKAFANLNGVLIIQNTKALPSLVYRGDDSEVMWMPLPESNDDDWNDFVENDDNPQIKDVGTPFLIKTTDERVFIATTNESNTMFFLKNSLTKGADWVYISARRVAGFMALPEVPDVRKD